MESHKTCKHDVSFHGSKNKILKKHHTHTQKTIHHVAVACKYLSPVQKVLMERTDIHNRVQPSGWTSHIHSTNDPKLFMNLLVVAHQWP